MLMTKKKNLHKRNLNFPLKINQNSHACTQKSLDQTLPLLAVRSQKSPCAHKFKITVISTETRVKIY